MAKNNNLGDFLAGIANKIRNLLGTEELINPQDFEDKIQSVYDEGFSNGGPTGITATAADVLTGKVFGSGGNAKTTGTMPNRASVSRPIKYQATDGAHLYSWVPYGYCSNYDSNGHLIEQPFGSVASAIGLTAAKIVKGNTILGIAGSAPKNSLLVGVYARASHLNVAGGAWNTNASYWSASGNRVTFKASGKVYIKILSTCWGGDGDNWGSNGSATASLSNGATVSNGTVLTLSASGGSDSLQAFAVMFTPN